MLTVWLLLGLFIRFAPSILPSFFPQSLPTVCLATDLPQGQAEGKEIMYGVRLAVNKYNMSNTSRYKIMEYDMDSSASDGEPDVAKGVSNLYTVFHNPHCPTPVGVIGPYDSASAQEEIPVATSLHILLLGPSNTVSCLTQSPLCLVSQGKLLHSLPKSTYLRLAGTDTDQAQMDADFLASSLYGGLEAQTIDIVEDQDIYGTDLADSVYQDLHDSYRSASVKLYCITKPAQSGQIIPSCSKDSTMQFSNITDLATQIQMDSPNAVFFAGVPVQDAAQLHRSLVGIPFVGGSSLAADPPKFFSAAASGGLDVSNVYATFPAIDHSQFIHPPPSLSQVHFSPEAKSFSSDYLGVSQGDPPGAYSANGYDAANIILQAITQLLSEPKPMSINQATVLSQVQNGTFQGLFEPKIHFQNGDNNDASWYTIYQSSYGQHGWDWQVDTEAQAP